MAASPSTLLLPLGSASGKSLSVKHQDKVKGVIVRCSNYDLRTKASRTREYRDELSFVNRRDVIGLVLGVSSLFMNSFDAKGAGLPPEEKPKLCDDTCEKELENVPMVTTESGLQYKDIKIGAGPSPPVGFQVAANYVAMIPSGQIFDSSLEKGQLYIFRVGSGQVIKGLDEGMLSMKIGGKRRLYIPGPVNRTTLRKQDGFVFPIASIALVIHLAFPKGLNSAPGRPRVAPNSPVIFDVSLEYIPGLEADEE